MISEIQSNPFPVVWIALEDKVEKQLYLHPIPPYLSKQTPITCLKFHFWVFSL